MTLVVALRGIDGIVLAADSRGTIGDPRGLTAINDDQKKIFKLSKYCGIGISGSSELAAKIIDELKNIISDNNIEYVDDILDKTRELVRKDYNDWFEKFNVDKRPPVLLTLVGYHKTNNDEFIPRTYLLNSQMDFAPQLFPDGNCLIGVPQYAIYLKHRFYDSGMTVENLIPLAAYLISETATQDPKVGGQIRIAKINSNNGFEELESKDVDKVIEMNSEQTEKLKQFFFKR